MNTKTKRYFAVDKDGHARLFTSKPVRVDNKEWDDEQADLMTVSVPELQFLGLPIDRTWEDEPMEVTITINDL